MANIHLYLVIGTLGKKYCPNNLFSSTIYPKYLSMYIYRLFFKLGAMDTRSFGKIIMVFTIFAVMASFLHLISSSNAVFAQVPSSGVGNSQPNINAENLFNTRTMVLGNNVENLVILIPNEAHHGPNEESEARFLEQQFVPETAVINPGTTVAWFNGDVGHERTVDVANANAGSNLFSTGVITDMQASKTITFDSTGTYLYKAMGDEGVTMRGAITVSNIQSPVTNSANGEIDTVGVLMVPAQDKDRYVQEIISGGLTVDSTYDFNDLRGGQQGTGSVQTLIVWTSTGKDLNSVVSTLSQISSTLPYS